MLQLREGNPKRLIDVSDINSGVAFNLVTGDSANFLFLNISFIMNLPEQLLKYIL